MLFYVLLLVLAFCFPACGRLAVFSTSGIASSFALFAILVLFAAPVVSKARAVSNTSSSSMEPLNVVVLLPEPAEPIASPRQHHSTKRVTARKSRDSSSLSVEIAVSQLSALSSVSSVVVGTVVGTQQQSSKVSDPDIDSLVSAFAKVTVTAPLRPCLNRPFLRSAQRPKKSVRFVTHPQDPNVDVCDFAEFEIRSNCRLKHVPSPSGSHLPSVPGQKCGYVFPDGTIKMLKSVGIFNPPRSPVKTQPRCATLARKGKCGQRHFHTPCLSPPSPVKISL